MVHGRYGQFKVLVEGETVVDAGALAALGVLPSRRKVVEAIEGGRSWAADARSGLSPSAWRELLLRGAGHLAALDTAEHAA